MSAQHSTLSAPSKRRYAKSSRVCAVCRQEFLGRYDARCCSDRCRYRDRNNRNPPKPKPKREKPAHPTRVCLACGKTYVEKRRWRKTDYCSRECVGRTFCSKRRQYVCIQCGTAFTGLAGDRSLCSDECKAKIREKPCSICGKAFLAAVNQTLCSKACKAEFARRRDRQQGVLTCQWCGKTVHVEKGFSHRSKYCSVRCREASARKQGKYRRRLRKRSQPSETVTLAFLLQRDKGVCGICGKRVDRNAVVPDPKSPTLDHVIPLAKDGSHTKANCQLAHFACNSFKNDRIETLF